MKPTINVKIERPEPVPATVHMSVDERTAGILVSILNRIGGWPDEGHPRNNMVNLLVQLQRGGISPVPLRVRWNGSVGHPGLYIDNPR